MQPSKFLDELSFEGRRLSHEGHTLMDADEDDRASDSGATSTSEVVMTKVQSDFDDYGEEHLDMVEEWDELAGHDVDLGHTVTDTANGPTLDTDLDAYAEADVIENWEPQVETSAETQEGGMSDEAETFFSSALDGPSADVSEDDADAFFSGGYSVGCDNEDDDDDLAEAFFAGQG